MKLFKRKRFQIVGTVIVIAWLLGLFVRWEIQNEWRQEQERAARIKELGGNVAMRPAEPKWKSLIAGNAACNRVYRVSLPMVNESAGNYAKQALEALANLHCLEEVNLFSKTVLDDLKSLDTSRLEIEEVKSELPHVTLMAYGH